MTPVQVARCHDCARLWFPDQLICPSCGEPITEHTTALEVEVRHTTALGDVHLADCLVSATTEGPVSEPDLPLVARVPDGTATGDRLALRGGPQVPTDEPAIVAWVPTSTREGELG